MKVRVMLWLTAEMEVCCVINELFISDTFKALESMQILCRIYTDTL